MANNKSIHIIATIVIFVAVFSALFISQNQVFSQEQANNVSPFGINAFYVPESVATTLALQSSQEVIQALETQTVPEYLNLGVSWGRIHPAAFGSFSWDNIDSDKDGKLSKDELKAHREKRMSGRGSRPGPDGPGGPALEQDAARVTWARSSIGP